MPSLGLPREIIDRATYDRMVARYRDHAIRLPSFAELAVPSRLPDSVEAGLAGVNPDAPDPLNLFRVHWYNDAARRSRSEVPGYLVLSESITGVPARIVVMLGDRFPMIRAHKVLAAYGCLMPRLLSGEFDPEHHRAVWPSTGNYCRGGIAISRVLGCRGVAVLPEGMSAERFEWLEQWASDPADIIRTPGSESNVKEIYDACAELAKDPANVIFNQFSDFGNYLVHYLCTGVALEHVLTDLRESRPELRMAAFVAASGSAGTLGAGDYLKARHGARIVVVEALECPTLLYGGYGEHNIQGIGDKHVPFIHNVMNTDIVTAVSDIATDSLNLLFNTDVGKAFLTHHKRLAPEFIERLGSLGLSSIANVLAAIKVAKYLDLDETDAILTVATDGAELYTSEQESARTKYFPEGFDEFAAAETWGRHLMGVATDHLLELTRTDRKRIFNLGYYTWVEQQGVEQADFDARRDTDFWTGLQELVPVWDDMIAEFNARTGTANVSF
jgi:cysteine synthase